MTDKPIEVDPFEFEPGDPAYSFVTMHDRVFVTWFSQDKQPDHTYISVPRYIELNEAQKDRFNDVFNRQIEEMNDLLADFVADDYAADREAGLAVPEVSPGDKGQ